MSETHENGGPAFPFTVELEGGATGYHRGMSLRDWFAGQAAAAVINGLIAQGISTSPDDAPGVASAAYDLADAMLEARRS